MICSIVIQYSLIAFFYITILYYKLVFGYSFQKKGARNVEDYSTEKIPLKTLKVVITMNMKLLKSVKLVPLNMIFDGTISTQFEGENITMLWIPIDRSLNTPLIRQVYQQIRERILNGQLKPDEKLPSTRELSSELKVSRNVILERMINCWPKVL